LGDYIAAQGMKQGPMDLRQLEEALGATGHTDALVSLLTNPSADGPARILAEGGTFMWEQWSPGCSSAGCTGSALSQSSSDSFSHGWGSAGIDGILESLLGVTVTGAGASSVQIAPPSAGLSRASGTEWTERGPITLDWHHAGHSYSLRVSIPDNVSATVVLPTTVGARYHIEGAGGGHLVLVEGGRAVFAVGSGSSHIEVTASAR